jgi:hypothetical protein
MGFDFGKRFAGWWYIVEMKIIGISSRGVEQENSLANKPDRRARRLPFAESHEDYEALMGEITAMRERHR